MTATSTSVNTPSRMAAYLTLTGRVQGIGLRPAVARFAQQLSLVGYVGNTNDGVEIHVEGPAHDVVRFERELPAHLPASAEVSSLRRIGVTPAGFAMFFVRQDSNRSADDSQPGSSHAGGTLSVVVPPDGVVCDSCLAEVEDTTNRRYGYAFTSCTDCGPRYSIIQRMPYDRDQTSMEVFSLCDDCRAEYESPTDRRFHAQTNACSQCGPKNWLRDASDRVIADGSNSLRAAAAAILQGRIVALRGLGGYQLLVDATSQEAVERLRRRKQRRGKPLAVMVASLVEAAKLARLDEAERQLLVSPAGPVVVAATRSDTRLATSVTAELNTVGLMLPTTPLHQLLLNAVKRPLVCTSANVESDPLTYQTDPALSQLRNVADVWLEHDRPIRRPIDDSVVRVIAGRPTTIRLARGYAPLSLNLNTARPLVALGGHQKTSVALSNVAQSVLGPHIGNLDTVAARQRYCEQTAELSALYGVDSCQLVCDYHPEYFTTTWADDQRNSVVRVQHHHAHVAAGMLEHNWLERNVLGVSFDGTGYGKDGTIWGGEFLLSTASSFERVGHLRPFLLPGGERAVQQPWRVATSLVREAVGEVEAARLVFRTGDVQMLMPVFRSPAFSMTTTSAGRLFDGLAALVLNVERCQFEGQAAMLLESACDQSAFGQYDILIENLPTRQLDWRPLVRQVLGDRIAGVAAGVMAMRFHRGLATAIFEFCRHFSSLPVVLGGGVFQNRVLVELLAERFAATDQPLGLPGLIPSNDGGLAAGQLVVAAALARQRSPQSCV